MTAMDGAIILWFVLTLLSLIYIVYDLVYTTPAPAVVKLAWVLVILYTGPLGMFVYLVSCREPLPGTHEQFTTPLWKQAIGSDVHCLAGDVTGIIIAAVAISFAAVSAQLEMIIEYTVGFAVGLFIFQALFMKPMLGGSYIKALASTFMPEWLSMNLIMAGMIPGIFLWRYIDPAAADPATLGFWGSMVVGTVVGGSFAYPVNYWLVKNKLKHGMITVRQTAPSQAGEHAEHGAAAEGEGEMAHGEGVSKVTYTLITLVTLIILAAGVSLSLWAA